MTADDRQHRRRHAAAPGVPWTSRPGIVLLVTVGVVAVATVVALASLVWSARGPGSGGDLDVVAAGASLDPQPSVPPTTPSTRSSEPASESSTPSSMPSTTLVAGPVAPPVAPLAQSPGGLPAPAPPASIPTTAPEPPPTTVPPDDTATVPAGQCQAVYVEGSIDGDGLRVDKVRITGDVDGWIVVLRYRGDEEIDRDNDVNVRGEAPEYRLRNLDRNAVPPVESTLWVRGPFAGAPSLTCDQRDN